MLLLGGVITLGPPRADTTEIVYAGSDRGAGGAHETSASPTVVDDDPAGLDDDLLGVTPTELPAAVMSGDREPPVETTPTEVAEPDGASDSPVDVDPTATAPATPTTVPTDVPPPTAPPTPTTTLTPTAVPSPTATPTEEPSPTPTITPTPSPTPTEAPPPTPTTTPTITPTEEPSPTPTITPTPTPTVQVIGDCSAAATPLTGSVLQSGQYDANHPGSQAFDGLFSPWLSEVWVDPAYIGLALGSEPSEVLAYSILFANAGIETRAPNTWDLEGSSDGIQWTTVDSQVGQANWFANEVRAFNVASPGSFTHYRLHVFADNDDRAPIVVVSISELEMYTDCRYGPPLD